MEVSYERETAISTFSAEWQTVGDHDSTTVSTDASGTWLAKPSTATHCKIQAVGANLRYKVAGQATPASGFQLAAGSDTLVPVPNRGVSLAAEAAGCTCEYQWLR